MPGGGLSVPIAGTPGGNQESISERAAAGKSVRERWLVRFAESRPILRRLKQFQPNGKGRVRKGFAMNDVCAQRELAGNRPNGNILIGRPEMFRQNAGPVRTDVRCGRDLVRGILETVELDHHLFGDAAFGPHRREYICHGLFSPFELCWAVEPCWQRIWPVGWSQPPL